MRKVTTKFLILVFAGLFSLTVPFSHALADETPRKHGEAHGILLQDASEFLEDKVTSGTVEIDNLVSQTVACGVRNCNLKKNVCMSKAKEKAQTDENLGNALQQYYQQNSVFGVDSQTNSLFLSFSNYDYVCVKIEDQSKYTEKGWTVFKQKDDKTEVEKCYTAKNSTENVKQYCIRAIGGEVEVKAANSDGNGCEVIPVRWFNNSKCTFCSLLGGPYKVADTITETSRSKLAPSFAITIALGMLIWVAMKTLIFVSSMTKQDAAKYITEMIQQSYKFMIAFFALAFYNDIFLYIILPLLSAGISFGEQFVEVIDIETRFDVSDISEVLSSDIKPDYIRNKDNQYYDVATYIQLEHLAYNVNLQYSLLQTIGGSLVCLGWNYMIGTFNWKLGLGLACVVYGVAFSAFGFFLCMAFVFYLFDAVVQLGIVGGLLPFLVASWPFKITSKYTSAGFKMLLNSIFTFMMIGVAVHIGMKLIDVAVSLNTNPDVINSELNSGTDLAALAKAIDEIDTDGLGKRVNVLSVGFCLFMFANIMGFLLISRMSELVNRFAGGGMKGSAPILATIGASTIKGMATKLAAPTVDAVGKWTQDKAEKATRAVATAPISITKGTFKGVAKAGKWVDKKTGNVVSNKAKEIGNTVKEKAQDVGNSIANSKPGREVKRASKWLANSKAGKLAATTANATAKAVNEVRRDLGYQTKSERNKGIEDTQKEIFAQDIKIDSGRRPDPKDMD